MPISDYLPDNTELPDQFEPGETNPAGMVFPCCACIHASRPAEQCEACAHYLG